MSPSLSIRLLLTQSDARLLALAREGHERAFEALVQRYRRPLLRYCRRALLPDERAEDALQQAFLQAWLALERGVDVVDVKAWLYRIVHNAALNTLRVSGYDYCTLNETLSGADAPQADLDRRIAVREALAGLAALPEMQREALLRTAVEGRSHERVARDLGVSENALRGLVYRARATLRSAATALTPTPLLSWISSSANRGSPLVERLAEVSAGSGSAGMAGLLLKGGTVAMTVGLATGIGASHAPRRAVIARPQAHQATATPSPASPTVVASTRPLSRIRQIDIDASPGTPKRHAAQPRRLGSPGDDAQPDDSRSPLAVTPVPTPRSAPIQQHDQPASDRKGERSNTDGSAQGKATSDSEDHSGPDGPAGRDGGDDAGGGPGAGEHGGGSPQGDSSKGGTGSSDPSSGSPERGTAGNSSSPASSSPASSSSSSDDSSAGSTSGSSTSSGSSNEAQGDRSSGKDSSSSTFDDDRGQASSPLPAGEPGGGSISSGGDGI